MRTIFHANRKKIDGPYYAWVYIEFGRRYYDKRTTREARERSERARWVKRSKALYRINVLPKKCAC